MDSDVMRIINKALDGGELSMAEGVQLLSWDDLSDEAAAVRLRDDGSATSCSPKPRSTAR